MGKHVTLIILMSYKNYLKNQSRPQFDFVFWLQLIEKQEHFIPKQHSVGRYI